MSMDLPLIFSILMGMAILAYVVLWLIMPKAPVSELLRDQDDRRS